METTLTLSDTLEEIFLVCDDGGQLQQTIPTFLIAHANGGQTRNDNEVRTKPITANGSKAHLEIDAGANLHEFDRYLENCDSKSELAAHPITHTAERSVACEESWNTFGSHFGLNKHERVHSIAGPDPCNECPLRFRRESDFQIYSLDQAVKKPSACTVCSESFYRGSDLWKHMRVHASRKLFPCVKCGLTCRTQVALESHLRSHANKMPLKCGVCAAIFRWSSSLLKHSRTHTGEKPYICETCGKAFSQSNNLRQFKKIHTGEKPYACDKCSLKFIRRDSLKNHVCLHALRVAPFACDVREGKFNTQLELGIHRSKHSG